MTSHDDKKCRQSVRDRAREALQRQPGAVPMAKPSNKPDLAVEDAERPKAGDGTKTAALDMIKAALSKELLARAAASAAKRSKGMAHGLEELGSRAIVPRDVKSSLNQEISKLRTQADVFGSGGKGVMPKATRAKQMRATTKAVGPRPNMAEAEAAQMAGSYGDSVKAMNAKMDANLASRAAAGDATRASGRAAPVSTVTGGQMPSPTMATDATRIRPPIQDATKPGVVPPSLPGTNAVTPSQPHVPQPVSAQAGQTYAGNTPVPSAQAEATRIPGPVAPQPMSPQRVEQLRAATPQSYAPAPVQTAAPAQGQAPRPMTAGRGALVLGGSGAAGILAASMANRPMQQQAPY